MKSFTSLQMAVGRWSKENFGDNESPYFVLKIDSFPEGWKVGDEMPRTLVAMESLCPLLGIVEEIGELAMASSKAEVEDAIGDIFIYVCDYTYRAGFEMPIGQSLNTMRSYRGTDPDTGRRLYRPLSDVMNIDGDALIGLIGWAGQLCHATLKRHEGIRGFEDHNKYQDHCILSTAMLLGFLERYATEHGLDLTQTVFKVWDRVSQRDWKKAPDTGQSYVPGQGQVEGGRRIVPKQIYDLRQRMKERDLRG